MSEFGEIQGYMFHFRDGKPLMEGDNLIPAYACLCAARSSVECGCGAFDWPIPKRDEMEKIESIARSYQPITDGNDMTANIEALVKKHIAPFGLSNAGGYARLVRDALTEQAETHAIELRAYEATVANLTRERDEAVQELVNIRDATPSEWSDPTDFKAWAQSRAAHTIGRIAAVQQQKEGA